MNKNLTCMILGHKMNTPFFNGLAINKCIRCGYENSKYESEGYRASETKEKKK